MAGFMCTNNLHEKCGSNLIIDYNIMCNINFETTQTNNKIRSLYKSNKILLDKDIWYGFDF